MGPDLSLSRIPIRFAYPDLEQSLNALSLMRLGVGLFMKSDANYEAHHVQSALTKAQTDPGLAQRAREQAERIAGRGKTKTGALDRIAAACLEIIGPAGTG